MMNSLVVLVKDMNGFRVSHVTATESNNGAALNIPLLSSSKRPQRLARLGFQMCRGVCVCQRQWR